MTTTEQTGRQLNRFWENLARTVAEGNFDAYAENYHEDAVFISSGSSECYPVAHALGDWRQGFTDTLVGKSITSLQFRFGQQLHDPSTAHQTGIFRYSKGAPSAEPEVRYVHFETLLVKPDRWLILMEYQKKCATVEQWNNLG
jgi:hypothetical protein